MMILYYCISRLYGWWIVIWVYIVFRNRLLFWGFLMFIEEIFIYFLFWNIFLFIVI